MQWSKRLNCGMSSGWRNIYEPLLSRSNIKYEAFLDKALELRWLMKPISMSHTSRLQAWMVTNVWRHGMSLQPVITVQLRERGRGDGLRERVAPSDATWTQGLKETVNMKHCRIKCFINLHYSDDLSWAMTEIRHQWSILRSDKHQQLEQMSTTGDSSDANCRMTLDV